MTTDASFLGAGGSELAPCSTTEDLHIAVRYARRSKSRHALLFRVIVKNFMDEAGKLTFLSAFPHEGEVLYPPLTYFRPLSRPRVLAWEDGIAYTVIDVEPRFPS